MAEGFDPFRGFKTGQALSSQSGLGVLAKNLTDRLNALNLMAQEAKIKESSELRLEEKKSEMATRQMKSLFGAQAGAQGAVPTKFTQGGVTYEFPQAEAKMEEARIKAKSQAELLPRVESLTHKLVELKGLFDGIPRTKPGIGKFFQTAATRFRGATGEIPQVERFRGELKQVAGTVAETIGLEKGRKSDADIRRAIEGFPDPTAATREQGLIGWLGFFDTVNGLPEAKAQGLFFDPIEMGVLTPDEFRDAARLRKGSMTVKRFLEEGGQ